MHNDDMDALLHSIEEQEEAEVKKSQNYNILKMDQGSNEWLLARCGRITGSDAHILFMNGKGKESSLTKIAYARKIAYERMYGDPLVSDISNIKQVAHGLECEMLAISEYEQTKNCNINRVGFLSVDRGEYAGMIGCSPDGMIANDGMIEIKCPFNQEKHLSFFYGGMNEKEWIIQCRFNMFVANREWIDFVSYDPRRQYPTRMFEQRIYRCKDWELELIEKIEGFELLVEFCSKTWKELNEKHYMSGD